MDVVTNRHSEDIAVLRVKTITTGAHDTAINGYSRKDVDDLPVVTNGYSEENSLEAEIKCVTSKTTMQEINNLNDGSLPSKGVQPLKTTMMHVEPSNKSKTDPNNPSSTISQEYLNGPDQVLPADSYYTVQPNGRVQIANVGNGYAALKPISVPGLLHKTALEYPCHLALASKLEDGTWKEISYREYEIAVRTCAKAFIKLGLKRYNSVCILGFNSPEWFISDVGAIYAGGFAVGIYTTNTAESCYYCAESSSANIIVVQDKKQLDKILEIKDRLPELKAIVQYEGKPHVDGVLSWEELMEIGRKQPDDLLEGVLKTIGVNECCTLVYTSGTTGNPKAAMLSHDSLTWSCTVCAEYLEAVKGEEVVVSYLPLSHVAAQIVDIYFSMGSAAAVYFGDNNALKGSLVTTLKEAQPTQFLGVPRVWEKIKEKMVITGSQSSGIKKSIASWAKSVGLQHNLDKMNGVDGFSLQYKLANMVVYKRIRSALGLERCKTMLSGAAPLATDIKKYFWSLDIPLMEGFGMSESAGCHTLNIPSAFMLESIGKTIPGSQTKILNPDSDCQGEILMKGRNIFMGYLNELQKTKETFTEDGWFRSGDVGTIDKEGFVYITGRIKELLITAGGENISPVLIENNIKEELPCISQAFLIGDQRKFLSVLLTLQTEVDLESGNPKDELNVVAKNWLQDLGCNESTVSEVLANKSEKIYAAIQAGIDRANVKAISNAQRVQKFAILSKDFSVTGGEFGPTMKTKRNVVVVKYADIIESFYEDMNS